MSRSSRVVSAALLTLLIVGAASVFFALRVRNTLSAGSAGLSYLEKTGGNQPKMFGLGPGQIMMVDPDGAGGKAGLRRGDEILSINGLELTNRGGLARLNGQVRTGDVVTYRIQRNAVVSEVGVRFENPFKNPLLIVYAAANGFVAACFLTTGLFIFIKKPDDRRVVVFFAMMLAGAVAVLSNAAMAVDNASMRGIHVDPGTALIPLVIWIIFGVAFAPLTLHMGLVFPQDRPIVREHPRVLRLVYGVPAVAVLVTLLIGGAGTFGRTLESKGHSRAIDVGIQIVIGLIGVA